MCPLKESWRRLFNTFTETIFMGKRLCAKIQRCFKVSPCTNAYTGLYCWRHTVNMRRYPSRRWKTFQISLEKVEKISITMAKCCLKIKKVKLIDALKSFSNKKWIDKECRLKIYELRKLANKTKKETLWVLPYVRNMMITWRNTRNCLILKRMIITMPRFWS